MLSVINDVNRGIIVAQMTIYDVCGACVCESILFTFVLFKIKNTYNYNEYTFD